MPISTSIDDRTFEQSVAELAVNAVKSKFPELLDYALAFQLVDRSEDDTKAVGFFGCRIGELLLYVPIFFVKGDIKGTDLGYIVEEDRFIPLTEDWINSLIKKKTFTIGEKAPEHRRHLGITGPDLRRLRIPPMDSKVASARRIPVRIKTEYDPNDPLTRHAVQMFKTAQRVQKQLDIPELPDVLALHNMTEAFLKNAKESPKLASIVFSVYAPEDFVRAVEVKEALCNVEKSLTKTAGETTSSCDIFDISDLYTRPRACAKLSLDEKHALVRGEVVIKDARDATQVRTVIDEQLERSVSNPSDFGVYDTILASGDVEPLLILPLQSQCSPPDVRLVIYGNNQCELVPKRSLWVRRKLADEDAEAFLKKIGTPVSQASAETFATSTIFVLVSACGSSAYGPYRVSHAISSVTEDHRGSLVISVIDDAMPYELTTSAVIRSSPSYVPSRRGAFDIDTSRQKQLFLEPTSLNKPSIGINTIRVGRQSTYYVVPLERFSGNAGRLPAANPDIVLMFEKAAKACETMFDGSKFIIAYDQKTYHAATIKQACDILCRRLHLRGDDAKHMIYATVDRMKTKQRFFVKEASQFDVPDFDAKFDPTLGSPVLEGGISVEKMLEHKRSFDPVAAQVYQHYKDENNYTALYQKDIDMLNAALNSGQKDIFNAAAIGALINLENIDDEVSSYLPALVKALDKLGRLLFMFYWHNDAVVDRYGKVESKALEDDLENVFKSLGDIVIRLRKNAPQFKDLFGSGIIGGETAT